MLVVREEVRYDCVWDGVKDIEDTHKIGVSIGLIMLGLSVVDLGNTLGDRWLKYTRWRYFGRSKILPASSPNFTWAGELGLYPCWWHWASRYPSSVIRTYFQFLLELGISQVRLARLDISFFGI